MLTTPGFAAHVARLVDPSTTPEARKGLATEVRDSIEVVHSAEYGAFLANFFPAFRAVLSDLTEPQEADNAVHRTRSVVLEILNRLPPNDVLRPRVRELLPLAMGVLQRDNEENAVTAIRIIFDLHKSFRPTLEPDVQPFLDFVQRLYSTFGETVQAAFSATRAAQAPGYIRPSTSSFKVITECPLIVMFLFQLYPSFIRQNIPSLLPLMVEAIKHEIPPERAALAPKAQFQEFIAAQVKTVSFLAFLLRQFQDTMKPYEHSIPQAVVQLLKACPGDAVPIRKELLVATRHILGTSFRVGFYGQIDLLLTESVLVGTGRAAYETLRPLAYSFLAELVHYVRSDLSLDQLSRIIYLFSTNVHDRTLSFAVQTTSVRLLLNLMEGILKKENAQDRTRQLLVRIMNTIITKYDSIANQVPHLLEKAAEMCARLGAVSNGEPLSKEPVGDPLRDINDCKQLIRTLTLGLKTVVWTTTNNRGNSAQPPFPAAAVPGGAAAPVVPPATAETAPRVGLLEDECELLAGLLSSTRQCFRLYNTEVLAKVTGGSVGAGDSTGGVGSSGSGSAGGGSAIIPATGTDQSQSAGSKSNAANVGSTASPEEKEILEHFAQIFTVLDVRSFQDVFGLRMPELFEHIVEKPAALAIPQHFLTNSNISKYFADILLNFLVSRLSQLGTPVSNDIDAEAAFLSKGSKAEAHAGSSPTDEDKRAHGLLKLFRILFASVTLFSMNEPVLKPHLSTIVRGCLSHAAKCENPENYLQLLRLLFKSLTNGKHEMQFELLYRDFMPLVEPVLDGLLELYDGPQRLAHRDSVIELCLTLPARPSTIFPYLPKQLKPMVWALSSSRDNIHFGLRAIEFWVETLQPAYLDILLDDVEPELTRALQRHARPARSAQGATFFSIFAMRILGKLGKRSRRAAASAVELERLTTPDVSLRLQMTWSGGAGLSLDADGMVRLASATLLEEHPPGHGVSENRTHKFHAWSFLRSCIVPFLGIDENLASLLASDLASIAEVLPPDPRPENPGSVHRTRAVFRAEAATLKTLMLSLLAAANLVEEPAEKEGKKNDAIGNDCDAEKDSPRNFAFGLCRYIALLHAKELGGSSKKRDVVQVGVKPKTSEVLPPDVLDPDYFLDAIIDVMSRERREHAEAGYHCLVHYLDALIEFSGASQELGAPAVESEPSGKETVDGAATEPAESAGLAGIPTAADDGSGDASKKLSAIGLESGECSPPKVEALEDVKEEDIVMQTVADSTSTPQDPGKSPRSVSVPAALSTLVERLCHCCYQRPWHTKWAGAVGFGAVIARVPVDVFKVRTSGSYEAHVVRALMFVVRDLSNDVSIATTTAARRSLKALLQLCHQHDSVSPSRDWSVRALRDVTVCITVDLTSSSDGARAAAKEALHTLAKTMKCLVAEVVVLAKEQILRLLAQRSLRQLTFPVQIGYVDAVTFCVELETPLLAEELFKSPLKELFLNGVVDISEDPTIEKLTEAEEGIRHRLVENKLVQTKMVTHLKQLRRRSVDFLRCITMKRGHLVRGDDQLSKRIISSFFKSIQSRDDDVVIFAKQGLKQAIAVQQNQKELLQTNLRAVLTILSDYKKLTIGYLQGFSRVLELLSHWFNVQLGEKLLEHLERWTEPEKLKQVKRWTPGTESLVGAAILDLFHLLPQQAAKFLVPIVYMVLRLEEVLAVAGPGVAHLGLKGPGAASTSPYRGPLLKFCNTHASEAVKYFLGQLGEPQIRRLFFVLLRADNAGPLCAELSSDPGRLIQATFGSPQGESSNGLYSFNGVVILDTLSRRDRSMLVNHPALLDCLVKHWNSPARLERLKREDALPLEQLSEARIMANCFIRHCREHAGEVGLLFHLLQVFSMRTLIDFSFVKDFYADVVAKTYSAEHKRAIMDHFLKFFLDTTVPQDKKVHALQFLIVPMLSFRPSDAPNNRSKNLSDEGRVGMSEVPPETSSSVVETAGNFFESCAPVDSDVDKSVMPPEMAEEKSSAGDVAVPGAPVGSVSVSVAASADAVLNDSILPRVMKDLLDQPDEVLRQYDEPLSAELLRLATLLVQLMPEELGRYRKELIKFGWNHLKREDSVAKQWAFVNVSRFFEAYQAPDKIILQVYVALLRYCQPEGRELVRRALDILTPALPKRLVHNTVDHKYPIWIRYTKKILLEEGHSLQHLVHIWQLIVRHSDLFYVARAQFVPIMVNSLARIGLGPNAPPDNRRLALDLADLIISWERKRAQKDNPKAVMAPAVGAKREREEVAIASGSHGVEGDIASSETPVVSSGNSRERPSKLHKTSDGTAVPSPAGISESLPVEPESSGVSAGPLASDADDYRTPLSMVEMVVNFLAQVAFRQMDRREGRVITKRCIDLIGSALELWPETPVRLTFLEKCFDQGAAEKQAAATASVTGRTKASGPNASAAGQAKEAKNEKADTQVAERAAARASALLVALDLSLVLIDRQGNRFVSSNVGAIRAMVAPAITDQNVPVANLFAKLLTKLIILSPPSRPRRPGTAGSVLMPGTKGGSLSKAANRAGSNGAAGFPPVGQAGPLVASAAAGASRSGPIAAAGALAPSVSQRMGPGGPVNVLQAGSAGSVGGSLPASTSLPVATSKNTDHIYALVETAVEVCLKGAMPDIHCGLVVLKALVDNRPEEYARYQDLVVKALHRMTKDSLSMAQGTTPGSAPVNSTAQGSSAKEKSGPSGSSNPSASSSGRAGNVTGSGADAGSASSNVRGGDQSDGQALILGLSLVGAHITSLEQIQKRTFFQVLWVLIDRCIQVKVLLEIVRIIDAWIRWKVPSKNANIPKDSPLSKEPLLAKEKVTILLKMMVFERITGPGSESLVAAYLNIILNVFGGGDDPSERRPELLLKLERAFMIGLKTDIAPIRSKFFALFDAAADRSPVERLRYVIAKQDWEPLADSYWIRQAVELLLASVEPRLQIVSDQTTASLPKLGCANDSAIVGDAMALLGAPTDVEKGGHEKSGKQTRDTNLAAGKRGLAPFVSSVLALRSGDLVSSLRELIHFDVEIGRLAWLCVFPRAWSLLPEAELPLMETAVTTLFSKEYHSSQRPWPRSVLSTLLEGVSRCTPLPAIRPDLLFHIGNRWNSWHIVLPYLDQRSVDLRGKLQQQADVDDKRGIAMVEAELEAVMDASSEMYRLLNELDMFAGLWKQRCDAPATMVAMCFEQQACFLEAQSQYTNLNLMYAGDIESSKFASNSLGLSSRTAGREAPGASSSAGHVIVGKSEFCVWESRWIECAKELCQWEVLTEFSRSCLHTDVLHDCLWRVPEWSSLKELLARHPVEDGPQLKLYESYMRLQENRLDIADTFIVQGMHKALNHYCSMPISSGPRATSSTLVQFQQLVELQESSRILAELTALSRQGAANVNVEQKIESLKTILNSWRERLPGPEESLRVWSDVLTWRNHVHSIVVTVLEALKNSASSTVAAAQSQSMGIGIAKANGTQGSAPGPVDQQQAAVASAIVSALTNQQALIMGVNETAWSVHRFARACRKQGLPGVALSSLQQLYPFGTMELTEYFVKTKENAKSYMAGPPGLENNFLHGLNDLNRCNMDHFSAQQKAHLFTLKGRFLKELNLDDDVAAAYSTALTTASDVSAAWLAWGEHSDDMHEKCSRVVLNPDEMVDVGESSPSNSESALAWREAAANSYLHAVKFGSGTARRYIPRALRLLALDLTARRKLKSTKSGSGSGNVKQAAVTPESVGVDIKPPGLPVADAPTNALPPAPVAGDGVHAVFMAFVDVLPAWVWLPWIPQLVPMLGRAEASVAQAILIRISQMYPQAVFFPLRAYLEEGKDIVRPTSKLVTEALRNSRPNTAPLLPAAATAQLVTATKQFNSAHAAAQEAKRRLLTVQETHKKLLEAAATKVGTPEHPGLVARGAQLQEESLVCQKTFDRALKAYQTASTQKKTATANVDSSAKEPSSSTSGPVATLAGTTGSAATPSASGGASASTASGTVSGPVQATGAAVAGAHVSTPVAIVAAAGPGPATVTPVSLAPGTADAGVHASDIPNTASGAAQGAPNTAQAMPTSAVNGSIAEKNAASETEVEAQARASVQAEHGPLSPKSRFEHADIVMAKLAKSHQLLYVEIERIAQDLAHRMKPQQEEQLLGLVNALLHRCYQLSVQSNKEVVPSLRSALVEVSRMCFGTRPASEAGLPSTIKVQASIADLKPAFEAELAPQTAANFPTRIEPFIERLRRWKNVFQRRVDAMPDTQRLELLSRNLIEIQHSDVEVFGQYMVAEAAEPNPGRHIKISRFSADTRVVRRHSGAARGVAILGSDGRKYHFILETSVNAITQPTEERAAQLCRLLNASFFGRHAESARRGLKVEAPVLIATGAHTRLVSDDPSFSSLAEGLERYQESISGNIDDPLMEFRQLAATAYTRRLAQNPEGVGREDSIAARVEAYHAVCEKSVPDTCLSSWIGCSLPSPNLHFAFKKTFAESLGTASIVSHALAIGARRPQNVLFSWSTGAVSNLHMRPVVSSRGLLEIDEAVPFRLTRNIRRFLGNNGVHGSLFGSMAVSLRALRSDDKLLKIYLDMIVRDELLAWAAARTTDSARSADSPSRAASGSTGAGKGISASGRDAAEQDVFLVEERLEESVKLVMARLDASKLGPNELDAVSLQMAKPGDGSSMTPAGADIDEVTYAVYSLIDRASRPEHLAQMDSSWLAFY